MRDAARRNGNPLLEWQPQEGWGPICEFLDTPVPEKPFPRLNDENTIKILRAVLVTRGLLTWAALLATPAVAYWGWVRFLKM